MSDGCTVKHFFQKIVVGGIPCRCPRPFEILASGHTPRRKTEGGRNWIRTVTKTKQKKTKHSKTEHCECARHWQDGKDLQTVNLQMNGDAVAYKIRVFGQGAPHGDAIKRMHAVMEPGQRHARLAVQRHTQVVRPESHAAVPTDHGGC